MIEKPNIPKVFNQETGVENDPYRLNGLKLHADFLTPIVRSILKVGGRKNWLKLGFLKRYKEDFEQAYVEFLLKFYEENPQFKEFGDLGDIGEEDFQLLSRSVTKFIKHFLVDYGSIRSLKDTASDGRRVGTREFSVHEREEWDDDEGGVRDPYDDINLSTKRLDGGGDKWEVLKDFLHSSKNILFDSDKENGQLKAELLDSYINGYQPDEVIWEKTKEVLSERFGKQGFEGKELEEKINEYIYDFRKKSLGTIAWEKRELMKEGESIDDFKKRIKKMLQEAVDIITEKPNSWIIGDDSSESLNIPISNKKSHRTGGMPTRKIYEQIVFIADGDEKKFFQGNTANATLSWWGINRASFYRNSYDINGGKIVFFQPFRHLYKEQRKA